MGASCRCRLGRGHGAVSDVALRGGAFLVQDAGTAAAVGAGRQRARYCRLRGDGVMVVDGEEGRRSDRLELQRSVEGAPLDAAWRRRRSGVKGAPAARAPAGGRAWLVVVAGCDAGFDVGVHSGGGESCRARRRL